MIVETIENILINLYCIDFFIVIKKISKIVKKFRTDLIFWNHSLLYVITSITVFFALDFTKARYGGS